jgi:hypothetical protein
MKVGDTVILRLASLHRVHARIVASSNHPGWWTIELLEGSINASAYRRGDRLSVAEDEMTIVTRLSVDALFPNGEDISDTGLNRIVNGEESP